MPVFTPVISTNHPVTITSGMPTLTYDELVASISSGAYQIKIESIYIEANTLPQLANNWYFARKSQSGYVSSVTNSYLVSPNQFQSTAIWDLSNENYCVDNLSVVNYDLDPLANVTLVFLVIQQTLLNGYDYQSNGASQVFADFGKKDIDKKEITKENSVVKTQYNENKKENSLMPLALSGAAFYLLYKIL